MSVQGRIPGIRYQTSNRQLPFDQSFPEHRKILRIFTGLKHRPMPVSAGSGPAESRCAAGWAIPSSDFHRCGRAGSRLGAGAPRGSPPGRIDGGRARAHGDLSGGWPVQGRLSSYGPRLSIVAAHGLIGANWGETRAAQPSTIRSNPPDRDRFANEARQTLVSACWSCTISRSNAPAALDGLRRLAVAGPSRPTFCNTMVFP